MIGPNVYALFRECFDSWHLSLLKLIIAFPFHEFVCSLIIFWLFCIIVFFFLKKDTHNIKIFHYILQLQEQFHELEEERRKHMDVFIKSDQVELEKIWKSCYISENEKTSFYAILETKVGDPESTLELYESHIDNWKKFHDNHLTLFIKVKD